MFLEHLGAGLPEQLRHPLAGHAARTLPAGRNATKEVALRLAHSVWVRIVGVPEGKQSDQLAAEELQALIARVCARLCAAGC
jgi:stage III sporulation protein SpoIIIAA